MTDNNSSTSPAATRIDPQVHAAVARATSALSPVSALLPVVDWAIHLGTSPGKQLDLASFAVAQAEQLVRYAGEAMTDADPDPCVAPAPRDRRFGGDEWNALPFNVMQQSYLLAEQWWSQATHGVWGMSAHHENVVSFMAHHLLSVQSPENYLVSNPVALKRTFAEGGGNLVRGMSNLLDDVNRATSGELPAGAENFVVGRNVGVTPGKVVFRNRLIELIQYEPTTAKVKAEPILIIPAWIMKYYILDLSPHNSLIKHLVDQGYTVFCVSWKNPGSEERDLGMDDYLDQGFHAALNAVNAIVPKQKVHATGYCLGGTLLSIAAAAMARDGHDRIASLSLLAAQVDFSEPGELGLFIDESAVSLLGAQMAHTGYLTGAQMSGAFQMLRSYDLIWARLMRDYVLGDRLPLNDLMAWNADATRLPALMHSQYLRRLYLDNDLARGRYEVGNQPVVLNRIDAPIFSVGTETDHVAPWKSVYKIHGLTVGEVTFALTNGGHNAGIVSYPGRPRRHYSVLTRESGGTTLSTDAWQQAAKRNQGSWWPEWLAWLDARSTGTRAAPRMGTASGDYTVLGDAPGTYVMER